MCPSAQPPKGTGATSKKGTRQFPLSLQSGTASKALFSTLEDRSTRQERPHQEGLGAAFSTCSRILPDGRDPVAAITAALHPSTVPDTLQAPNKVCVSVGSTAQRGSRPLARARPALSGLVRSTEPRGRDGGARCRLSWVTRAGWGQTPRAQMREAAIHISATLLAKPGKDVQCLHSWPISVHLFPPDISPHHRLLIASLHLLLMLSPSSRPCHFSQAGNTGEQPPWFPGCSRSLTLPTIPLYNSLHYPSLFSGSLPWSSTLYLPHFATKHPVSGLEKSGLLSVWEASLLHAFE